jgi:two-component system, sensor histidine kinase PhcS
VIQSGVTRLNDVVHDVRLKFSKFGSITSASLIILGVGLDRAIYPERAIEFFLARLGAALATLWVLRLLMGPNGKRHFQALTFLWLILPQVMISWMIYETQGVASIYFVGLQLALYGVGMIVPINYLESLGFGLFTVVVYFLACYLHPLGLGDGSHFTANVIFIIFAAIISTGCTFFNEQSRIKLFELREQVASQNLVLIETNKALADIKGQLLQREKMAAIGTLSAGLLHELNNPVNYSMMAINLALTLPASKSDELLEESLVDARDGMVRVQNIVSDLKTFAYQKAGDNSQRVFLFENAVRSALRLAGHELKGITVVVDMPQDTHVRGDEPAMIGVLINLLSNAAHAVHAAKREQPQITVRGTMLEEGGIERLFTSVRDNGQGIDPVNISRVFEPFFTTRDVGAGLGLGLSMSYSIVQRHGGTLAVTSELGAWTEFTFDLPRP